MTTTEEIKRRVNRPFFHYRSALFGLFFGAALTTTVLYFGGVLPPPPPPPTTVCDGTLPGDNPDLGIRLSWDETSRLTDKLYTDISAINRIDAVPEALRFRDDGLKGGRIGKCYVQAIVNSLEDGSDYVYYQFGKEPDGKMALSFIGGKRNPDGTTMSQRLIYRCGTNEAGFCPRNCLSE